MVKAGAGVSVSLVAWVAASDWAAVSRRLVRTDAAARGPAAVGRTKIWVPWGCGQAPTLGLGPG